MSTVTENLRQALEDLEQLEKCGAICLNEQEKHAETNSRKRTLWDHRVKYTIHGMQNKAESIVSLLADEDGVCNDELAAISGVSKAARRGNEAALDNGAPNREIWRAFYDRLKGIQDYYKAFSSSTNEYPDIRDANFFVLDAIESVPTLSSIYLPGEERGKFLDFSSSFSDFVNWKSYRMHRELEHRRGALARLKRAKYDREKKKANGPKSIGEVEIDLQDPEVVKKMEFHEMDNVRFIRSVLTDFGNIPRFCKYGDPQYKRYLVGLRDQLRSFYERTYPLAGHDNVRRLIDKDFEIAWLNNRPSHWNPLTNEMSFYALATDRLFATEAACRGHMNGKKYRKAVAEMKPGDEIKYRQDSTSQDKFLAANEYRVLRYLEFLSTFVEAAIQNVRKKQSRSLEELQGEEVTDEEEDESAAFGKDMGDHRQDGDGADSDEEDETGTKVRNPLSLPLGWDGKPIPYWLYKLHGLGREYNCEICGNHSYRGRRVFERHFQEWRHAFGMRCLKIPNTLHFKEITKIDDAIALYEKLKTETEAKSFLADQEIEVEDAEGNVMTPQTYEDLRRQGII